MLGQSVGSYRITGRIGEGGMGSVYLAEHSLLGRTAAIKVLHPELSHQPEIVERFFNEARSASGIRHPGIVEIFDFGYAQDDSAYIVMEHLAGESLRDRLDSATTLDPTRAASIGRQIASALQAAHDQEIIHRDLKPDNIFLVPDQEVVGGERAKILDFGIAKLAAGKGSSFRTQTGQLFGTPAYMAPEQCRGAGRVDHRADLYAVGCILYEMVCGRPPFVGEGGGEVLAAQIYEEPPAPRELAPHVPKSLEAVILRLLEKDPAARYGTADELAKALRGLVQLTGEFASLPAPTPSPTPRPRSNAEAMRTTLASAASATISSPPEAPASSRRGRRRTIAIAAGAIAAVAIGAVGLGTLATRSAPAAEVGQAQPPDARSAAQPIITSELEVADAGGAQAELADDGLIDEADAAPQRASIVIDSSPRDAQIYKLPERELVGATPFTYETPGSDDMLEFAVVKAGHETETLRISGEVDSEHLVELSRERRRPAPTRADRTRQRARDRSDDREDADEDADDATEPSESTERAREAPLNPFTRDRRGGGEDEDEDEDEALNPFER